MIFVWCPTNQQRIHLIKPFTERYSCGAQCGRPDNHFGMVKCSDCSTRYHYIPIDCTNGTLDPIENNRNKIWICSVKCRTYFVQDIKGHKYNKRYGHIKYLVLWQDNSESWEWEEDMIGCPKMLGDYAKKHNITIKHIDPSEWDHRRKVGYRPSTRSVTAAAAAASPGKQHKQQQQQQQQGVSCEANEANWLTLEKTRDLAIEELRRLKLFQRSPPIVVIGDYDKDEEKFANFDQTIDQIMLLSREQHAYSMLYWASTKSALIADGTNSIGQDNDLLLSIKQDFGLIEIRPLDFDQQHAVDHCASSAAAICLCFARFYMTGKCYDLIKVNKYSMDLIRKKAHKYQSEMIRKGRIGIDKIKMPACPVCKKKFSKKRIAGMEKHIESCLLKSGGGEKK